MERIRQLLKRIGAGALIGSNLVNHPHEPHSEEREPAPDTTVWEAKAMPVATTSASVTQVVSRVGESPRDGIIPPPTV